MTNPNQLPDEDRLDREGPAQWVAQLNSGLRTGQLSANEFKIMLDGPDEGMSASYWTEINRDEDMHVRILKNVEAIKVAALAVHGCSEEGH